MSVDPYEGYLSQAEAAFERGEVVKAGQIWQAILKRQPDHQASRQGLMKVKTWLAAQKPAEQAPVAVAPAPPAEPPLQAVGLEPPPPPAPDIEPMAEEFQEQEPLQAQDPERLLKDGCTLYDMGQTEEALAKWEQILALEPNHPTVRSYINSARKDLGMALLEMPAPAIREDHVRSRAEGEDVDKLIRDGATLFDMGQTEDALVKWERALELDPNNHLVKDYVAAARKELGEPASAPTPAYVPDMGAEPGPTGPLPPMGSRNAAQEAQLAVRLHQADELMAKQRYEEAQFAYQMALDVDPNHLKAREGVQKAKNLAQRLSDFSTVGRPAPTTPEPPPPLQISLDESAPRHGSSSSSGFEEEPVTPPPALTKGGGSLVRPGLKMPTAGNLPELMNRLPFLRDPKVWIVAGGALVALIAAFAIYSHFEDEANLKNVVRESRAAAIAPVRQSTQAVSLAEDAGSVMDEGRACLSEGDPVRAYFRAKGLLAQNPGDAAAAQLLEQAKAAFATGEVAVGASLAEFEQHLKSGDLDAAAKVLDALLRANPEDAGLQARAGRLYLRLAAIHANGGDWADVEVNLKRGRALFPQDKRWQAHLHLLAAAREGDKSVRAAWVALLG